MRALLILLFALGQMRQIDSRTEFALPLTVATPNQEGIYEFNFVVKYRVTMTIQKPHQELNMVDYSPDLAKFTMRSNDPALNTTVTLTNSSDIDSVIQYNGLHYKIFSLNGESPARPLVVPFNATVLIRVTNEAESAITLHMHGLDNQWFRDGVSNLQQCGIAPRSVYSYRFAADTPGTHWFHGHLSTHRSDGLLGSLIILPRNATQTGVWGQNPPGREYVAMLQHWPKISISDENFAMQTRLGKWSYGFENQRQSWADHRSYDGAIIGGSIPTTGYMINDKGWHDQSDIKQRPQTLPLEVFKLKRGETIRLRFINGGISAGMMISIENHQMTIAASDGINLKPLTAAYKADMLMLWPGERYDVLITGAQTKKTHYIIFESLDYTDMYLNRVGPKFGLAKLVYEDVNSDTNDLPDFEHRACSSMNKCIIVNCPFPEMANRNKYTCINMGELRNNETIGDSEILKDDGTIRNFQEAVMGFQFGNYVNGYNFLLPRAPPYFYPNDESSVVTPCDRSKCTHFTDSVEDDNCRCFHHLNVTLNNVVQLTLVATGPNDSSVAHPFHMHGTHFYVMKIGYPNYSRNANNTQYINTYSSDIVCEPQATCNQPQWRNSSWSGGRVPGMNKVDPPLKDTIIIPAGGYAVIRFRATNPGWFFAHCHVLFHEMGGMAFAMRIGNRDQMPAPPSNFPHSCGTFEDRGPTRSIVAQNRQFPPNPHLPFLPALSSAGK